MVKIGTRVKIFLPDGGFATGTIVGIEKVRSNGVYTVHADGEEPGTYQYLMIDGFAPIN